MKRAPRPPAARSPRRRPVTVDDLFRLKLVAGLDVSPAGDRICLALAETDEGANRSRRSLWLVDAESGAARPLTRGPHVDGSPRFSADGRSILFASNREKPGRLYRLPLDGGEPEPLGEERGTCGAIVPSPDGKLLAAVIVPAPAPAGDWKPPLRITRLRHKENGALFLPEPRALLVTVDLATGKSRRLLAAPDEIDAPVFSPDSATIVFAANLDPDTDRRRDTRHLYAIPAAGGRPRRLTRTPGPKSRPVFSPDGAAIAYLGHEGAEGYHGVENHHPFILDLKRGATRDLCPGFDRTASVAVIGDARGPGGGAFLRFSDDGRELHFLASSEGTVHLHTASVRTGRVRAVSRGACAVLAAAACERARRFALLVSDAANPGDVYLVDRRGATRRLTGFNDGLLAQLDLAVPEELRVTSDGRVVQGWTMRPPRLPRGRRAPAILQIHGGPHAMYGLTFFHEFQLLCAAGYAVGYCNPCGSQGYGRAFAAAAMRRWGSVDYDDVMAFADAFARLPFVDGERLGVTGGSYGGYMTNWIVAHTDRFRAAVTQRSLSNLVSFFGASDCGWEFIPEMGGTPWENPDGYRESSPLTHVERIRTPLLILHSDEDIRTPIEQAEQLFTALKWLGRDVEMLRFFGENHDLSRAGRPKNRRARLEALLDWFDRKLRPGRPPAVIQSTGIETRRHAR